MQSLSQNTHSFSRLRSAHLRLGKRGEDLAYRLLINLGMEVLQRNYLGKTGEIDIVARDGSILCFIEVKTRRRSARSRPADAVTKEKQKRIIRTAKSYLRQIGNPGIIYRFDIVELVVNGHKPIEGRYWPNEFSSPNFIK